ncbi:MAG TPA: FliM/FliN family flagellar motor switch protein [Solirubrobacteraceae bacterium]|nr:FliM/FliN family flagellar motor switch protein [Solirubrobacteraceae bacterium]
MHKLDFSQPTRFTTELRRRVERALAEFCEPASLRLSAELNAEMQLSLGECAQLTWAAGRAGLPADSLAAALEPVPGEDAETDGAEPASSSMLLSVELPLVLQALEAMLGGDPTRAPSERRLSEIDWRLARRLCEAIVSVLSPAWAELAGVQLSLGALDAEADAGVLAPANEPTLALPIACSIAGTTSAMCLLVPWRAVERIATRGGAPGAPGAHDDSAEALLVRQGLACAPVRLRAEVGSLELPMEQMLALAPGTVIELRERVRDGIRLSVERIPFGRAHPGCSGARRAVKLESVVPARPSKLARRENERTRASASTSAAGNGLAGAAGSDEAAATPRVVPVGAGAVLGAVPVRVWVELGSVQIPFGRLLELSPGAVVELDQGAHAPVEMLVNGLSFAHGDLVVTDDGEWGVRLDELV